MLFRSVVVGEEDALARDGLFARRVNWLADAPFGEPVEVKVRHRNDPTRAVLHRVGAGAGSDGEVEVRFAEPKKSIAPGQAAVFYRGEQVLGGGWIA